MQVRDMVAEDHAMVTRIFREATADLRKVYCPKLKRNLKNTEKTKMISASWKRRVIETGNSVLGVVDYCCDQQTIWLQGLAIDRKNRNKGYARQLLDSLEQTATMLGMKRISLKTIRETGNVEFFLHLGYRVVNEHESERFQRVGLGGPVSEVEMIKQL